MSKKDIVKYMMEKYYHDIYGTDCVHFDVKSENIVFEKNYLGCIKSHQKWIQREDEYLCNCKKILETISIME